MTTKAQSKQSRYYYRQKEDRLAYQKDYYNKHKATILSKKKTRYESNKVKRTRNIDSLLRKNHFNNYSKFRSLSRKEAFFDMYFHAHGRPRTKRKYPKRRFDFHMTKDLVLVIPFGDWENAFFPSSFHEVFNMHENYNGLELTKQFAHFLGFKLGDSFVWKEVNRFSGKTETHTLCFDRSGLDMSHFIHGNDLMKLIEMRIETGAKGADLAHLFANKYSINTYLQMWRGNQLIRTSVEESALKDYRKYFPFDPEKEFEQKMRENLNKHGNMFKNAKSLKQTAIKIVPKKET